MQDYYVELKKVGRHGQVLFTTNFGFGFIAIYYGTWASAKMIKLSSSCHQTVLVRHHDDEEFNDEGDSTQRFYYSCSVCAQISAYPYDLVEREYPVFDDNVAKDFVNLLTSIGVYPLDAFLVVNKLLETITAIWSRIASGERIKAIMCDYNSKIEL